MLEDWSGMNKEKAKDYILNCQVYQFLAAFFVFPVSSFNDHILHSITIYSKYYPCIYLQVMLLLQSYDGGFGLTPGSESHGELKQVHVIVIFFPFCIVCNFVSSTILICNPIKISSGYSI